MKTTLFTLLFVSIFSLLSNAQDNGKFAVDLNLDPASLFDASAGPIIQMPIVKARYFLTSNSAVRAGVGTSFSSSTNYDDIDGDDYDKNASLSLTFTPGYEMQINNEKLTIFYGAQVPLSISQSTMETKDAGVASVITKNGSLGFGLEAVVGVDYYILNNIYVGAELSPGFMLTKNSDTEVDDNVTQKGGSFTSFSLGSSSGIRLGVRF